MTKEDISSLRETLALMSPGPYCEGYMAGAIRHVVRNVDTDSFHDHATTEDCLSPGKHDGDSIAVALKLLPQALDALEEANREIADLQTRLCNRMGCAHAVAFHLPGCPREQLATLGESTT